MEHLVIIGNGIAGITTARRVRKMSDMKITVISDETKYFFSRTAQTYGFVSAQPKENETNFYWEHSSAKKAVRFVYNKADRSIIGMNTYGIRYRHKTFEKWIKEKRKIEFVLEHLAEANFDPEFSEKHEEEIINKFNEENPGANLQLKSKRGLFGIPVLK